MIADCRLKIDGLSIVDCRLECRLDYRLESCDSQPDTAHSRVPIVNRPIDNPSIFNRPIDNPSIFNLQSPIGNRIWAS